jgi:GNAT superfamily N-acetyltransferase
MVEETKSGLTFQPDIVRAETAAHTGAVHTLFAEYAASLDFDLDFQDFQTEISRLPGDYAAPEGCLLLALADRTPINCIALRKWSRDTCEMKRLYVREIFRGRGVGRLLVQALIDNALRIGYRRIRLDTVPAMQAARRLYRSLGFAEIDAYRYNPIPGAEYMELTVEDRSGAAAPKAALQGEKGCGRPDFVDGPQSGQREKMP